MQSLFNHSFFCAPLGSQFKKWEARRTGEAKGNTAMTKSWKALTKVTYSEKNTPSRFHVPPTADER